MGSTLVSTGDRIDNDINKICFVIGAYRQGPVYENRNLSTTAAHPGEHVDHVATAGGEDYFIIGPDATCYSYGILELDKGIIATTATDYTFATDEPPAIPYHLNPGAYLRNVQFVDPVSSDVSPDEPACTISGTAGAFISHHTGDTFVDSDTSDGEAFSAGTTEATIGAQTRSRLPIRSAYFLSDPSDAYTDVVYLWPG
jgi:hypothetical protein